MKTSTSRQALPLDARQQLRAKTELALGYLLQTAGARSRRAVIRQLELLIHLSQATVALEFGRVSRDSLPAQKRALCLAPVRALEPATDMDAVKRYVHACLLGADVKTLAELVQATRSVELIARFERIARRSGRPEPQRKSLGNLELPFAA